MNGSSDPINKAELRELVDYFVTINTNNTTTWIASTAAFFSLLSLFIAVYTFYRQYGHSVYSYLASVWSDVLKDALENPSFINITKTSNYFDAMSYEESLKYDVYCYKCWGHVEDIIAKGFHKDGQFDQVIKWICVYHLSWLERNPTFFIIKEFWRVVESYKNTPSIYYGGRMIPTKGDEIDWDVVAADYHRYILSPFSPEMVAGHEIGQCRNVLLNYLYKIPDEILGTMDIADFGCGPGNLIPFVAGKIKKLTGVDSSVGALNIASKKAKQNFLRFESIDADMRNLPPHLRFDIVISVNSILPKQRIEVQFILTGIRDSLKKDGVMVAILPSFDTTTYLMSLWEKYYLKETDDPQQVTRIINAFKQTKKMDMTNFSYADDGHNAQCYHTKESILAEFESAGLHIVDLRKVHYPWSLTRQFDYGFFPDAPEEIWDWFVVAERAQDRTG